MGAVTVFVVVLALAIAATPPVADAQQPVRVYRIGILGNAPPTTPGVARLYEAFAEGLRERGYIEGENLCPSKTNRRAHRTQPAASGVRIPRVCRDLGPHGLWDE